MIVQERGPGEAVKDGADGRNHSNNVSPY